MSHHASLPHGRSADSETSPSPFATGSSPASPARQPPGCLSSFATSPPRVFVAPPASYPPQSSGPSAYGPGSTTAASAYPDSYSTPARGQQQRHYNPAAPFASSRSVEHVLQRFPSSPYDAQYSPTASDYSYHSPGHSPSTPMLIQPTSRHFAPRETYPSFSASYPPPSQPPGGFPAQFLQHQRQSRQEAPTPQRPTSFDSSAYQSSLAPMLEHRAQSASSSGPFATATSSASSYSYSAKARQSSSTSTSELATSLAGSHLSQLRASPSFSDRGPPARFQTSSPLSQHAEELEEDTPAPWPGSPTSLHSPTTPTAPASFHPAPPGPASSSTHHHATPHTSTHPAHPMRPQLPDQPAYASTSSSYPAPKQHRRSSSDPYLPETTPSSSASSNGDGDAYDPANDVDSDAYSPAYHKKSRRASGAGSSGGGRASSRPISPITGLPTKVLAKRLFPPRDAAKRRFYCPHAGCGKAFGRPSARETHLRSHNGIKPFACPIPICGRPFSVFSNLKRHMIVHPGIDFRGLTVHDLPHLEYDEAATPALFFRREDTTASTLNHTSHARDSGSQSWSEQLDATQTSVAHWGDSHERASGARWTGLADDEDYEMEEQCDEGMFEDENQIG